MPYRRKKRKRSVEGSGGSVNPGERQRDSAVSGETAEVGIRSDPPDATLTRIPTEHVSEVWPLCHDFIVAAAEEAEMDAKQLYTDVVTDGAQLWFVWSDHTEAALITRVYGDLCVIVVCGGNGMDRWLGLLDELEKWAIGIGCRTMRVEGRAGWQRKLNDYRTTRVVLEKGL